jgi:hypothetical protein
VTNHPDEHLGRLDDEAEQAEPSSTKDGPAAAGEYDPKQGSPGMAHPPTPPGFSEEITHYDLGKDS